MPSTDITSAIAVLSISDNVDAVKFLAEYKTERCKTNGCALKECMRYHCEKERRRNPFISNTQKLMYKYDCCRYLENCRSPEQCSYAHTENEILYHPKLYKTSQCYRFQQGEECWEGNDKCCPNSHTIQETVQQALKLIENMDMQQKISLAGGMASRLSREERAHIANIFHVKVHHVNVTWGWKEVDWKKGDKAKLQARVGIIKQSMRDNGFTSEAKKLKASGSLQDSMSSLRKITEAFSKQYRGTVYNLASNIKYNVNWSCHAKDGDKIFEVTPQNQTEAVNNFEELVKLVKSMKNDPL
ncbi:hypothetical protein MP228_011383 [Amoeboaphelidium protococcarum]|nr:hypothetical protein MP228_011383 [Amoeboaphelidium protococcarum]